MTPIAKMIANDLRPADMKAMNILFQALSSFVPTKGLPGLSEAMAEKLVSEGLAERGKPVGYIGNPEIGYRLSDLGTAVREARINRPRKEPRLKTLPPRIPFRD